MDALLSQIRDYERDADVVIVALETLAKIAWNDDEVSWASSLAVYTYSLHCNCVFLALLQSSLMLGEGRARWAYRTLGCCAGASTGGRARWCDNYCEGHEALGRLRRGAVQRLPGHCEPGARRERGLRGVHNRTFCRKLCCNCGLCSMCVVHGARLLKSFRMSSHSWWVPA